MDTSLEVDIRKLIKGTKQIYATVVLEQLSNKEFIKKNSLNLDRKIVKRTKAL
ncbi:MAG: hypothetical protein QXR37_02270 [Ignisphaera sp.]